MHEIEFNFINRSKNLGDNCVVIHQNNGAEHYSQEIVAWTVISNEDLQNDFYFDFSLNIEISVTDGFGRVEHTIEAVPGKCYEVVEDFSGNVIKLLDRNSQEHPECIELWNTQRYSVLEFNSHRSGRLLSTKSNIGPNENATFRFESSLFIAVVPQNVGGVEIEEGILFDANFLTELSSELHLGLMTSADIIMTGGGDGPDAEPFQFSLENVQYKRQSPFFP